MRMPCPSCGAMHSLEGWEGNADARQFARVKDQLPWSVSRNATLYLALFRPRSADGSGRGLIWSKALRLLGELQHLVAQEHIQWKGRPARPVDAAAWGLAMERIIENPPHRLPLTSHGYLTSIAYDIADDADRAREVRHNKAERDGSLRRQLAGGRQSKDEFDKPLTKAQMRATRKKKRGATT